MTRLPHPYAQDRLTGRELPGAALIRWNSRERFCLLVNPPTFTGSVVSMFVRSSEGLGATGSGSLTRRHERKSPFKLLRFTNPTDIESLTKVALVRSEEVAGFVEGRFNSKKRVARPERAHKALDDRTEMHALFREFTMFARPD